MFFGNRNSSIGALPDIPPSGGYGGIIDAQDVLPVDTAADIYSVNGSRTVTRLPAYPAGTSFELIFLGAPTFVHSTRLLMPGSVNKTFGTGDSTRLISLGDGIWRCTTVGLASGKPLIGPAAADITDSTALGRSFIAATAASSFTVARNVLINPGFTVNQRSYASSGALASGAYGHDRWKAGASGGNYSFTQLASPTTITIASSKSIIQVVEDKNVIGGSYVLSWTGTAVARVGIDSATPSGNFAVSPILITGQTAGTTMSVEFTGANAVGGSSLASNSGTLGTVQLEAGAIATPFEFRPYANELLVCQRYGELFSADGASTGTIGGTAVINSSINVRSIIQMVEKRANINAYVISGTLQVVVVGTPYTISAPSIVTSLSTKKIAFFDGAITGGTAGESGYLRDSGGTGASVFVSAEL